MSSVLLDLVAVPYTTERCGLMLLAQFYNDIRERGPKEIDFLTYRGHIILPLAHYPHLQKTAARYGIALGDPEVVATTIKLTGETAP